MPMTVLPLQAEPLPAVEIENGVIEEARRRQRRRRTVGVALGAAVVIAIAALSVGGGGSGNSGVPSEPRPGSPLKLTLAHGRAYISGQPALMGITPSLQAGNVGVCVKVVSEGDCNGPLPTATDPIYGGGEARRTEEKVGPEGEIDAIFTGPGVAAMRVAHLGTFKAEPAAGLPPGAKQIVFYRPPGSRGSVLNPGLSPQILQGGFKHAQLGPALTETLLDASGHTIPVGKSQTFTLPYSYWQEPQTPPARGRCAMSSSLPGVRTVWGQVATEIAPDHDLTQPGWFTCLHTWFSLKGSSYETAILLDAQAPGRSPAPLWSAMPVPGHPGVFEIPPVQREIHFRLPRRSRAQVARELAIDTKSVGRRRAEEDVRPAEQLSGREQTYWDVFVPPTVARRVGPAWVLVRDGDSLAQRIAFLDALHVTKIKLSHG